MTGPQPPQHDDPFTETRTQLLQALAVLATVSEAAARWAAVGVQNRASRAENAQRADRASALARSEADRLADAATREQARADREHIALAFDDEWLSRADLNQTAHLWRVATMHAAGGDEWARNAMANAEDRLAHLRPGLMDFYRQFRAEGHLPAEAMRAAAYGIWMQVDNSTLGPQARAHPRRQPTGLRPGANGRALGPGGPVLNDLDAAIRQEVADLAPSVDPQIVDQLQRQWRSQGLVPAADAAELLAQHARHLLHTAAQGGPPSGTATIRHGAARPRTDDQGQIVYDTVDVPVPTGQAGLQIAGQHADNLAQQVQADAAAARHLSGFAGREHDQGAGAYGTPDLAATPVDEHRAGLAAGHVDHGHAEHDQAGADQRRRMGQAFPPLTHVQQTHPDLATKQAAPTVPTQEKGRRR